MITPEMFERNAVGRMNCPVGMKGTNSNARCCTAFAAFFDAAASGALNQASRSSSIFASVGQPNQALSPVPRIGKLTAGLTMSGPTSQVWKIDQPPFSTGSLTARRVISVPQSPACTSALRPSFLSMSSVSSDCACTIGWSVASMMTIFSPL